MSAPINFAPQLGPVREDGTLSPDHSRPSFPANRSLERFQCYLAPLQRLGNQRTAWIGATLLFIGVFLPAAAAALKLDPRETSGNAVSIVRDLAQRAGAGR